MLPQDSNFNFYMHSLIASPIYVPEKKKDFQKPDANLVLTTKDQNVLDRVCGTVSDSYRRHRYRINY